MKPNICILPIHDTSWSELFPLALIIKKKNRIRPILIISNEEVFKHIPECNEKKVKYVFMGWDKKIGGDKAEREQLNRNFTKTKGAIARNVEKHIDALMAKLNGCSFEAYRDKKKWKGKLTEQYSQVEKVLKGIDPICLIISGDRHLGLELAILKYCRENGIPSIIPPISATAGPESLMVSRMGIEYHAEHHQTIKARFPKLVHYNERLKKDVFFYPVNKIEGLADANMLPENPWVMGGGHSSYVLASSEEMRDRLIRLGCKKEKIVVTGQRSHDLLFQGFQGRLDLRSRLGEKYKLDKAKKLVVMALPQLAEHGLLDWHRHWKEIGFLCQAVSGVDFDCIISLHPKMEFEKYKFLEEKFGLPIARDALSDILPAADVFMSMFSSTIPWAVLCRIPAIVFEFYGFDYKMYDYLTGVTVVREKKELKPMLERLCLDEEYYERMVRGQERWARYFSPFDGKCGERILNVIFDICQGKNVKEGQEP